MESSLTEVPQKLWLIGTYRTFISDYYCALPISEIDIKQVQRRYYGIENGTECWNEICF